jgi:hypothetical protein
MLYSFWSSHAFGFMFSFIQCKNDGSAIVFFTIFSQMYLLELGVPGLGEDIDWAAGISLFCRMAIGGMCIGMFLHSCSLEFCMP